jgi:hypothetical protein
MNEASKFARESFDRTLETGAETSEGFRKGLRRLLRMCAI